MSEFLYNFDVAELAEHHVSFSSGNRKMGDGFIIINTLSGSDYVQFESGKSKGMFLTNVKGTCQECSECQKHCYAIAYTKCNHTSCVTPYAWNTLIARHDRQRYFSEIAAYIKHDVMGKPVRFHVSGEIMDRDYFMSIIGLASVFRNRQFYLYTHRIELAKELYLYVPDNLTVNLSTDIRDEEIVQKYPRYNQFIIDNGGDKLNTLIGFHCPAEDKNGNHTSIQCNQCGRCWMKHGVVTYVYPHGSKKNQA